jgi:hypothetical protein
MYVALRLVSKEIRNVTCRILGEVEDKKLDNVELIKAIVGVLEAV